MMFWLIHKLMRQQHYDKAWCQSEWTRADLHHLAKKVIYGRLSNSLSGRAHAKKISNAKHANGISIWIGRLCSTAFSHFYCWRVLQNGTTEPNGNWNNFVRFQRPGRCDRSFRTHNDFPKKDRAIHLSENEKPRNRIKCAERNRVCESSALGHRVSSKSKCRSWWCSDCTQIIIATPTINRTNEHTTT